MNVYTPAYIPLRMWEIVPERLRDAMERAQINQSQLARKVGVKQPSIARLLTGETKTTKAIDLIAQVLGTTSAHLRGEDEEPLARARDRRLGFRGAEPEEGGDLVKVQEIDFAYGLGGAYMDQPVKARTMTFSRKWLRNFTDSPTEYLYFAQGIGDSMEPRIHSSDVVLIDTHDRTPKGGDLIWACAFGQVAMIKRLRPMPDGSVKILSDNPNVPPETAHDGELHVLGRVVAIVKKA